MLVRVRKLETARVPPVLAAIGGSEGWRAIQADVRSGLADGRYDPRDTPVVVASLRRWMTTPV
jgi:hypothetical protein